MPIYKTTPESRKQLVDAYTTGLSAKEAGNIIGISTTQAKRLLKKAGVLRSNAVPQHIKDEILRLYLEEKMSDREIAARLGMSTPAVGTHLTNSGKRRSVSEAQCLVAMKREYKKGRGGWWQSTKTGKWEHGMSVMELLRMQQLDADNTVESWTREAPYIEYAPGKRYIPDLMIKYRDGAVVVEEIKPSSQINYEENIAKWCIARILFAANGIGFEVVSENRLGGETAIRSFNIDGLQGIDMGEKRARQLKYWSDYHKKRKAERKIARGNDSKTQAAA